MLNVDEIEARIEENAKKRIFAPSIITELIAEIRQLRSALRLSELRIEQLSECIRGAPGHPPDRDGFTHGCSVGSPCEVCRWHQSAGRLLVDDTHNSVFP